MKSIATHSSTEGTFRFLETSEGSVIAKTPSGRTIPVEFPSAPTMVDTTRKIEILLNHSQFILLFTGEKIFFKLPPPEDKAWDVLFQTRLNSPNHKWIPRSTGGIYQYYGTTIDLLDWKTGKTCHQEHSAPITAIAEDPITRQLIIADSQGLLHLPHQPPWDIGKKRLTKLTPLATKNHLFIQDSTATLVVDISQRKLLLTITGYSRVHTLESGIIYAKKGNTVTFWKWDGNEYKKNIIPYEEMGIKKLEAASTTTLIVVGFYQSKIVLHNLLEGTQKEFDNPRISQYLEKVDPILFPLNEETLIIFYKENTGKHNQWGQMTQRPYYTSFFYSHGEEKRVSNTNSYQRPIFTRLMDGSLAYCSHVRNSRSHITIISKDGETVVEKKYNEIGLGTWDSVEALRELPDGSIAVEARTSYSPTITILRPILSEVGKIKLEIKANPNDLSLYEKLTEAYPEPFLFHQGPKLLEALLAGLQRAIQAGDLYQARRFYKKAKKLAKENILSSSDEKEVLTSFILFLKKTPYRKEKQELLLEYYKRYTDSSQDTQRSTASSSTTSTSKRKQSTQKSNSAKKQKVSHSAASSSPVAFDGIEEDINELQVKLEKGKCKTRLLVGEGDFAYSKALTGKHQETHPLLGQSITATEFLEPDDKRSQTQANIDLIRERGITVLMKVDGTKLHESRKLKEKRFQRIQWNFPFSVPDDEAFKATIPAFFRSAFKLQSPGDRIHITLMQEKDKYPELTNNPYWQYRQIENPIVLGSASAGYRLIRKRLFENGRYPGYHHTKTGKDEIHGGSESREFVFEKVDPQKLPQKDFPLKYAEELMDPQQKKYTIEPYRIGASSSNAEADFWKELEDYYFACSTDEDSSDYWDSSDSDF